MKLNKNNFKLITCAMSAMMIFSLVGCGDNSNQKVDIFSIGALEGQTMEVDADGLPVFDETVELHVRLGVDGRNADQQVRGVVVLPEGTGKTVKVLVVAKGDKAEDARKAGADIVGDDDVVAKIMGGW